MRKTRSTAAAAVAVAATLAFTGCSGGGTTANGSGGNDSQTVINIVKLSGGDWFNRMDVLDQEWAQQNPGWTVVQRAGDDASEEKQIAIINDAIPQKPLALTVVPNSPQSVEAVLKRAQDAGIIVVTHEAPDIKNASANIEAFDNNAYGAFQMDKLADCMGGEGQYAHIVGSLTVASHNAWAVGALEEAEANYPDITRVADPISSDENEDTAYQRAKELLSTYPDIKGFLGSASTDIAGIGRAVAEAGLEDSTCVIGTSTPSTAGELLKTGAVDVITGWDPGLAGQAMLEAVQILADGGTLEDGMNLNVPGYEAMTKDPDQEHNFYGNAWIAITPDNLDDYPF